MSLTPNRTELLARARADLRMGVPVVLTLARRALFLAAAETLTESRLDVMRSMGEAILLITPRRAETLKAHAYSTQVARLVMPASSDTAWIAAVANPADDLSHPMKGPFQTLRGGDDRLEKEALALCKSAQLLPAGLIVEHSDARSLAATHGLTTVSLDDAETAPLNLVSVVDANLPIAVSEKAKLHIFRPKDGREEHYALEIGRPDRKLPVLCRLHSACFTGDVLGSLKCDCGPQLHSALDLMGSEGTGVLLYLNQEGRGIGLANKMRAYFLQDQGFDTVEANHRLGFEDDERDFRIGSHILKSMGFSKVRLMTNNPRKVGRMEDSGITVCERIPLKVGVGQHNEGYLNTKANKSGHLL